MSYKLPAVSEELNARVDRWYERSITGNFRYADLLFSWYMMTNPLLLMPIGVVPEEVAQYAKQVLLTTLRKLEKQAKIEGRGLPRVKKETIASFQGGVQTGEQEHSLELAIRYANENGPMCRSVQKCSQQVSPLLRQHIQFPFIYALAHIENQGNADKLNREL